MSFKFVDKKDITVDEYQKVWKNNGLYVEDSGEAHAITMVDALSHPNSTQFFPVTVENIIREAMEPVLIGSQLLERIQYKPGMQISFGSVGAITADDVDESGEYPEVSVNFAPGAEVITIGKSGLAIKFSDEWKRYSLFDQLSMYIRKMGQALARHKEQKIWAMLSMMGVVTHDNINPNNSVYGTTTGYDTDGTANGSLNLDDLYEAYGQVLANGYNPDMLIMHPLTFTMFLTDPVLRHLALCGMQGGAFYNGWTGNGVNQYPWDKGLLGKMGPGLVPPTGATPNYEFNVHAAPKLPSYLGLPLSILISPYVPFNPATKLTDIYMVDSSNLGAIIVDEEPTMEEIPDRLRDKLFELPIILN